MNAHLDGAEISAFLDGVLTEPAHGRVNTHMAACTICRGELESLRHVKRTLAAAPRKNMPADIALSLEHRLVTLAPRWRQWVFAKPVFWIPVGAVATTALMVSLWMSRTRTANELPVGPLLVAHARYGAEALIPEDHLVISTYSDQLAALNTDTSDSETQ